MVSLPSSAQAAPKFKGKISRVLAAKCSLSCRVDALGESSEATIGIETRAQVEARLRQLEGRALASTAGKGAHKSTPKAADKSNGAGLATTPKSFNTDGDVVEKKEKKEKKEKTEKTEKKRKAEEVVEVRAAPPAAPLAG